MTTKPSSRTANSRNVTSEIAYLARALKAPSLAGAVERLTERARPESWSHEESLTACLQREVAAREAHGGEGRIHAAQFPSRKSLEEFDFDHQRSLKRETITHLGTLDFITAKENVVASGRPALARPTCRSGWGSVLAKQDTGSRSPPPPNGSPAFAVLGDMRDTLPDRRPRRPDTHPLTVHMQLTGGQRIDAAPGRGPPRRPAAGRTHQARSRPAADR